MVVRTSVLTCVLFNIIFLTVITAADTFVQNRDAKDLYDITKVVDVANIIPVAVIGSGPAGLVAAATAARAGYYCVLFQGPRFGGQFVDALAVENWPGVPKMNGYDIIKKLEAQAVGWGTRMDNQSITDVDFSCWPFVLKTSSGQELRALSVIVATGVSTRKVFADVPGKNEYWGHGVSPCAICEAPQTKGCSVIVVGDGDGALKIARAVAFYANEVTVLTQKNMFSVTTPDLSRKKNNTSTVYNAVLKEIKGEQGQVTGVIAQVDGITNFFPAQWVFLSMAPQAQSDLVRGHLTCTPEQFIVTAHGTQQTSVPGVFAAGRVTCAQYTQAPVAASQGMMAALDAINFLGQAGFNQEWSDKLKFQMYDPAQ